MTEIVERLRENHEALRGPDYYEAYTTIEQQAASLAAKDKEIETKTQAIADLARTIYELKSRAEQAERALAEAVEVRDRLRDDIRQLWGFGTDELRICEHCDAWMTIEEAARVEDISLCPREAFGSIKFPDEKCFKHRAWIVKEERNNARAFVAQHGSDSRERK